MVGRSDRVNNMSIYTFAVTLILVMDPLGNIPVFLSILRKFDAKIQNKIILRETFIAFIVLTIFLFFGRYILHSLSITTPALSIAGGIILFLIAIRMIFPSNRFGLTEEDCEEPLIVPLAVPLTAGPSAIAVLLLFAARDPKQMPSLFLGVLISCAIFLGVMLAARYLMRFLGRRGLIAIERLMGMILTTIAVQMFITGVVEYLRHWPLK